MRKTNKHLVVLSCVGMAFWTGCSGNQSALNPAGEQAGEIYHLWSLFCVVMALVYVLVQLYFIVAISRSQPKDQSPIITPDPRRERRMAYIVGGLAGVTAIIILVFMVKDFLTGYHMRLLTDPHPLRIQVTAHQWWWEVQYENEDPTKIIITANEIHIPLAKAVQFDLQSADVIHSFWAPNFDGKKDVVPGHPTSFWFRATKTGTFYGQCAEFCGLQHAHMRFALVVQTPADFQDWLSAQGKSAIPPKTDLEKLGEQVFLSGTCVLCHTVSGTSALGTVGPNLSHLASRHMIAAETIYNTRGHLAAWVLDAPQIKPGVRMPQNALSPADLQALLAYLGTLK